VVVSSHEREGRDVTAREIGLRLRLRRALRQMEAQHQRLRPLYHELARALEYQDLAGIRQRLEQYRNALDAHFSLEDDVLFPALQGLEPGCTPELVDLSREHGRFIEGLGELQEMLAAQFGRPVAERIEGLQTALVSHERREEAVLAKVLGAPRR
jgi:iron-sulfur cluster repair protein YtfE (RIC family)